jgi:hypothetical protein
MIVSQAKDVIALILLILLALSIIQAQIFCQTKTEVAMESHIARITTNCNIFEATQ